VQLIAEARDVTRRLQRCAVALAPALAVENLLSTGDPRGV
jgi:hypothetical protein